MKGKDNIRKRLLKYTRRAFRLLPQMDKPRILDIGCGSGRYCIELARRGARLVVGIDFAENMLRLARNLAERNGVSHVCRFINADFLNHNFENKFDICIAIGVLEYLQQPLIILERMKCIASAKLIISLPVQWTLRSLLRKIRLGLKGCPVYFYTKRKIERLLQLSQVKDFRITRLDRDYLIIIKV